VPPSAAELPCLSTEPLDLAHSFNALRAENASDARELDVIEIEGAAAGEIARYHPKDRATLTFEDALINFEPY
jgi:hypothetical protein